MANSLLMGYEGSTSPLNLIKFSSTFQADTYAAATTDAMNYQVVTASTGTSMKITFISVWGNVSSALAGTVYKGQNFRMTPGTGTQLFSSFGSRNPVFQ
jgi:hypothetical protein